MAGHESARTTGLYDRRKEEVSLDEVGRIVRGEMIREPDVLNIPLSPDKEAKLRERAAGAGKNVADYVLQVLDEDLAITEPAPPVHPASPAKPDPWMDEFHAWVASHPHLDYVADDSRESIYAGRGE